MRTTRWLHTWVLILAVTAGSAAPITAAEASGNDLDLACELGITLALSHETVAAESVFVSLLSRSPGDARALNNLGNLHLWRGDPQVALAFYRRAAAADTTDAGILLNEATALLLAGERSKAAKRAAEGVRRAGGTGPAADLLGLLASELEETSRASRRTRISREEVLSLLEAAVRAVPVDSTAGAPPDSTDGETDPEEKPPAWRSAGARGALDSDIDTVVYWKR